MVFGWMFNIVGCHAMSKGVGLIYKLGYLIAVAVCCPICPVCPVCPDIIHISWISTFRGHDLNFVDISVFC